MTTSIPPSFPNVTHLHRWVFHPHGRGKGSSFTLSFYDSGIPGTGGNWILYKFYQRTQEMEGRKGSLIFHGQEDPQGRSFVDVARTLIESFCASPGFKHAKELREEAERLDWTEEGSKSLSVALEAKHEFREGVHRYTLGIVSGEGSTQVLAKEDLYQAIGKHCSYNPRFHTASGITYVLLPQGNQWAVWTETGPVSVFHADNIAAAEREFSRVVNGRSLETVPPQVSTIPARPRKQSRPSIRAPQ